MIVPPSVVTGCAGQPRMTQIQAASGPVPISDRITQTLAYSNHPEPPLRERLQHERHQRLRRLNVHIMRQDNIRAPRRIARHRRSEDIHRHTDPIRRIMLVVISVHIEIDDMIRQRPEIRLASGRVARCERRAEVRRVEAEDSEQALLETEDVLDACFRGDVIEVDVPPAVGADLVAGGVHAADESGPRVGRVVDAAAAVVVAVDEEGRFCVVFGQEVEDAGGEGAGAVVECQGYCAGDGAAPYD